MPQDQHHLQDRSLNTSRPRALAEIDGGRARLGLAVIGLCSVFWIAILWVGLRLF